MTVITHRSKFGFVRTIQKIKENGEERGWYRPTINNFFETELFFGLPEPNKVAAVSMRLPRIEFGLLKANKKAAVMLPLEITVYEAEDRVYISWLNPQIMIDIFGRKMNGVVDEIERIINDTLCDLIEDRGE